MSRGDPRGYYSVLGVAPSATATEIRTAYRRLAKEHHPDANGPGASAEKFRQITEAYETLSDVNRRATYDNSTSRPEESGSERITPIVCSRCQKVAVQPRYLIFWTVVSFLVATQRSPTQGIFCSSCARRTAWGASTVSAVAGWWGIPWGPIYTVMMIIQNAWGGERRREFDDELLWHNAVAFALSGQHALSYALARQLRKSASEDLALKALRLMDVLERQGTPTKTPKLKNPWGLRPISGLLQTGLAFAVPVLAFFWLNSEPSTSAYTPTYEQVNRTAPQQVSSPYSPPAAPVFDAEPIDISTGEIRFMGRKARLAPLEIVTRAGSNYYVKMVNLQTGEAEFFAFIRGGDPFEVNMPLGDYEMRYAAGQTWYGEELLFGPSTAYSRAEAQFHFADDGYQYSGYTVELILRTSGNLEVDQITASEF